MASPVLYVTPAQVEVKDYQEAKDGPNNVDIVATLDEEESSSSQRRRGRPKSRGRYVTRESSPTSPRAPASLNLHPSPLPSERSSTRPSSPAASEALPSPSVESVGSLQSSIFSGPPTTSTQGCVDGVTDSWSLRKKHRDESPTRQLLVRRDFFRHRKVRSDKAQVSYIYDGHGTNDSESDNDSFSDTSDDSEYHLSGEDCPEHYTIRTYSHDGGFVVDDDSIDQSFSEDEQESEAQHSEAEEPLQAAKSSRVTKGAPAPKATIATVATVATINPTVTFNKPKEKQRDKARESMLKFLRCGASIKSIQPGFVYCFSERATPGHVKIGSAVIENVEPKYLDESAIHIDAGSDENVQRRLIDWIENHSLDVRFEFGMFMPCAVLKMEKLIHRTLHEQARTARCRKSVCKTNHTEWFEISPTDARPTVEKWQQFSMLRPYEDKHGSIETIWCTYIFDHCGQHPDLSTAQWVDKYLPELTGKEKREVQRLKIRQEQIEKCEIALEELRLRERELEDRRHKVMEELWDIQTESANVKIRKAEIEQKKSQA